MLKVIASLLLAAVMTTETVEAKDAQSKSWPPAIFKTDNWIGFSIPPSQKDDNSFICSMVIDDSNYLTMSAFIVGVDKFGQLMIEVNPGVALKVSPGWHDDGGVDVVGDGGAASAVDGVHRDWMVGQAQPSHGEHYWPGYMYENGALYVMSVPKTLNSPDPSIETILRKSTWVNVDGKMNGLTFSVPSDTGRALDLLIKCAEDQGYGVAN